MAALATLAALVPLDGFCAENGALKSDGEIGVCSPAAVLPASDEANGLPKPCGDSV